MTVPLIRRLPFLIALAVLLNHLPRLSAAPAAPSSPAELTARDFFRPFAADEVRLSPSGNCVAFTAYEEDSDCHGLRVIDLATHKLSGLRGSTQYDINEIRWAGDEHIAFSVIKDKRYACGLYVSSRDRLDRPVVINERDVLAILGSPQGKPEHFLLWARRSAREWGGAGPVVEMDLTKRYTQGFDEDFSNASRVILPPKRNQILGWWADRTGRSFCLLGFEEKHEWLYRTTDGKNWNRREFDFENNQVLAIDQNPDVLLLGRLASDGRWNLVRWNMADGASGPVLQADPRYNLGDGSLLWSADEQEIAGLLYVRQAPQVVWLRQDEEAMQAEIDAALPERFNLVTSRSRDGARAVVLSLTDRAPGVFYLYDHKTRALSVIARRTPWLPESLLSPAKFFTYKAHDGLQLDAYLTLPANYTPGKPAPLIVLPHGGPWLRDVWGYHAEAQFFASRGYLVFQPNYRGSAGYNAEISVKPQGEFRKMHEDVTDGVHALVNAGMADPKHIAIVGASFGGYLAICGAAYEPDLYRCAVSIAGVFDWERIMKDVKGTDPDNNYSYQMLLKHLGDPKVQREKFEAMSPILASNRIKIPIFIAHGESDRVADSSQSHRLAKALTKAGIPLETMFVEHEGHGFAALKNRIELYERIESFLKKNL